MNVKKEAVAVTDPLPPAKPSAEKNAAPIPKPEVPVISAPVVLNKEAEKVVGTDSLNAFESIKEKTPVSQNSTIDTTFVNITEEKNEPA